MTAPAYCMTKQNPVIQFNNYLLVTKDEPGNMPGDCGDATMNKYVPFLEKLKS